MGNTRRQAATPARKARPATTPEQRENQLIGLSVELAEKQLQEGTASAQVITHFLKLGSSREKLEQERLAQDVLVLKARAEQLESQKRIEELYANALSAMRAYAGQTVEELDEYAED